MSFTLEQLTTMKRQELQSAAAQRFGKDASRWLLSATNLELRDALTSGDVPPRFATNGAGDLAAAIASAIQPLMAGRLDEDRVCELIDERLQQVQRPQIEIVVKRPDGQTKNVGVQHEHSPSWWNVRRSA
jgi:hypothetical protein